MFNRRKFLALLGLSAAASKVSYFFAPAGGWHSDVIAHAPAWWSPEGLQLALARLDAHYAEIRGSEAVPLTDAMWAEARALKVRNDAIAYSDPRWKQIHGKPPYQVFAITDPGCLDPDVMERCIIATHYTGRNYQDNSRARSVDENRRSSPA